MKIPIMAAEPGCPVAGFCVGLGLLTALLLPSTLTAGGKDSKGSPPPRVSESRYLANAPVWKTPPFRTNGFQLEIQISSLGTSYDPDKVRKSIVGHDLGEWQTVISPAMAAEWGYSFTHLNGQTDGAGRRIQAGYPTPPTNREACLPVIEAFLQRQYIAGAGHPWSSMNGHFPWHHYAAEFGFDQLGSEIGESINSYQWHVALTRGAARQYGRPWFMDFSAWHGPSITDYSEGKIWGENSGPDHGHSMSLFERSLFMCYMAGAGQITAEAGGAIAFLTQLDEKGRYRLSPYGEVCQRLRRFSQAHPDVGVPITPFGIVLDRLHGAYPGFEERQAFAHFDYNRGDSMTWDLINLLWPGGWEVMGRNEAGTMVNGPFGDLFDILLQNAPQRVLDSYPCLLLSGDIRFSADEVSRYTSYVQRGGTLILNRAYLPAFPDYARRSGDGSRQEIRSGKGRVIVYGPDFDTKPLAAIIGEQVEACLPVKVTGAVQYLVNIKPNAIYVTLINNSGVTKAPRTPAAIDTTKAATATVHYQGGSRLSSVKDARNGMPCAIRDGKDVTVTVGAGEAVVLEVETGGKKLTIKN